MDIDYEEEEEDMKENDENILKYNTAFTPNINLLTSPISSLIEHLCPDISIISMNTSSINNHQINETIKSLQQNWTLKKWKLVMKHSQLLMQSTSNKNHQISSINYHLASMQNLLISLQNINHNNLNNNSEKPYQIIENSSHFAALNILFKSNRDCIPDSQFLSKNQLMQFYANLVIIQFKSTNYDTAQDMISNTLFQFTHFRKPMDKHIKSRDWSQVIQFWRNDNSSKMLKFLEKYPSIIQLVIIYISIQLKLDTDLVSFDDIQWIIQYLLMQQTLQKYIKSIMDQIYVLKSIYLLQQNKYNDSLLMLNKCCVKNMPLATFMKGWICFYIEKYEDCRKYLKESAQTLSFGVSECLNFYAFMCVESNKYENALNYLQQAIQLTLNENHKSVYSLNWIQIYMLLNKDDFSIMDKVLKSIKIGCNKCFLWEQSFKHSKNNEISKYHTLHIRAQISLLFKNYQQSQEEYQRLIGLISTLDIDDEQQTVVVYQEFCCTLIGQNDWKTLNRFISRIDRDDFQLNVIKIESLIQQKQTENVLEIIKEMCDNLESITNDLDKKKVLWWLRMFSGRCYEIENNLKLAEKNYELAMMNKPNCLLTMYYHVNVMRKVENKGIEAAVCWLTFCGIPLDKNEMFYKNICDNESEIEKYLSEKITIFNTFGVNHQPLFCKNGVLFVALFEKKEYQLDKLELIEMTKYCVSEWSKAIDKMSMRESLLQIFTMSHANK